MFYFKLEFPNLTWPPVNTGANPAPLDRIRNRDPEQDASYQGRMFTIE
jgi:hypothetical protein